MKTHENFIKKINKFDYKHITKIMEKESISSELKKFMFKLIENSKLAEEAKEILLDLQRQGLKIFVPSVVIPSSQSLDRSSTYPLASSGSNFSNEILNTNNYVIDEENSQKNYEDLNEIKPVDNKNKDDNKKSKEKKILNKKGNIRRVLKPDLGYNYTFDGTESTSCSCCGNKMYKSTPVKRVIIVTLNKIQTEEHTAETLRCNICNVTKTAPLPEKINQNFGRYHYSTVAHLISLRYAYGVASYRIEQVSQNVGLKISDSTQWYIFEQAASVLRTFFSFLKKFAANSKIIHADDTHVKVLSLLKDIEEAQDDAISQGKNPDNVRRGIHTTNITAIFNDEKNKGEIVLFDSGLHHCGEIIAELLENRIIGAEVVLMSDASSSNTSKLDDLKNDVDVKNVNCNSHAMRKFKEIKKSLDAIQKIAPILKNETSDRCEFYLSTYKEIFDNDLISRNFSNEERLKFHFEKSYPLMLAP